MQQPDSDNAGADRAAKASSVTIKSHSRKGEASAAEASEEYLCSLSDDILWTILDNLKLGSSENLKDLLALSASNKSIRNSITRYPAHILLRGKWKSNELAGLCEMLPHMCGLASSKGLFRLPNYAATMAWGQQIPPHPFLCCSRLLKLDLGCFFGNTLEDVWGRLRWRGGPMQLPQSLTELRIPGAVMPDGFCAMIEELRHLRCLDCRRTAYYPTSKLSSLHELAVGGELVEKEGNNFPFYRIDLPRLVLLTKLDLMLPSHSGCLPLRDFDIEAPHGMLEFKLASVCELRGLGPLVNLLSQFTSLKTLQLDLKSYASHIGNFDAELLSLPSASAIRELSMMGIPLNFHGISASNLTRLNYWSRPNTFRYGSYGILRSKHIAAMSCFRKLKGLGLCKWSKWEDLSPLLHLHIEELECADFCMLQEMLCPGCLLNLRAVFFSEQWSYGNQHQWLIEKNMSLASLYARVSHALLALPQLETMGVKNYSGLAFHAQIAENKLMNVVSMQPAQWQRASQCAVHLHVIFARIWD